MKENQLEISREELFDVNMMTTLALNVTGRAERRELASAFENTVSSYEGLNTRITINENGEAFYEKFEHAENGLYTSDKSLSELINEQERIRFRLECGEYLRLYVDDSGTDEMALYFFLHHIGGDGKSICYFAESFLKSLNGETLQSSPLTLLHSYMFPLKSRMKARERLYVKSCNMRWKKLGRVFDFAFLNRAYNDFWSTHRTETQFSTVDEFELNQCLKECREHNTGFTSYYMANLIKNSDSERQFGLAVDIRANNDKTMGNQVSGINIKHLYDKSLGVIGNAVFLDEKLKGQLGDARTKFFVLRFLSAFHPSLLDAITLEREGLYHSRLTGSIAKVFCTRTSDFSISNLGKLDIETEYGKYKIRDAWFVPPNVIYARDVLGLVSVNGHLNITRRRYCLPKKTEGEK